MQNVNKLMRPTELLEKYQNTGYTTRDIGNLFKFGMIKGEKTDTGCIVIEQTFIELLEYKKTLLEKVYCIKY
jgi:hypothetical protein